MPRRAYVKGQHLVGATFPAADPRKAAIRKGQFLTGDPQPGAIKRVPLPPDLESFQNVCNEADRLATSGVDEIRQRLAQAQKMLNDLRAAARRR